MQVLCGYPHRCQGYAGTLQVSSLESGVCRSSAGILIGVRGMQVLYRYPHQCRGHAEI